MKCEICKRENKDYKLINIGLNIGYEVGEFANNDIKYEVKPRLMSVISIYLCSDCEWKLKKGGLLSINILPKIKEFLTERLIKNLIIESLE